MNNNVEVLYHSSIKITGSKTIYIDPYQVNKEYRDADYIFITHSHYDHFSVEDIEKIRKENTIIIVPETSKIDAIEIMQNPSKVISVKPDITYSVENIEFTTTYSYNKEKQFHPKDNEWVGYIITLDNKKYYVAGDTDNIPEIQNIECNIAFLPVGGTYTMDYEEAAKLANIIQAEIIIPVHYGSIVGTKEDAKRFKELVTNKEVKILL